MQYTAAMEQPFLGMPRGTQSSSSLRVAQYMFTDVRNFPHLLTIGDTRAFFMLAVLHMNLSKMFKIAILHNISMAYIKQMSDCPMYKHCKYFS